MLVRICSIGLGMVIATMIFAMQDNPERVTRGQVYVNQEAHDAVQDEKIKNLESRDSMRDQLMFAMNDKMNYALGGIAVGWSLIGILQIYTIKKRS